MLLPALFETKQRPTDGVRPNECHAKQPSQLARDTVNAVHTYGRLLILIQVVR